MESPCAGRVCADADKRHVLQAYHAGIVDTLLFQQATTELPYNGAPRSSVLCYPASWILHAICQKLLLLCAVAADKPGLDHAGTLALAATRTEG